MANVITVGRIGLLFFGISLLFSSDHRSLLLSALIAALVILADGVDGWVARVRNETSKFGAVFDIVGDRIVEAAYLVSFSYLSLIPLWIPLLVLTRGFLVDGLRGLALEHGKTAFGANSMMVSRWGKALTSSRTSRALYGAAKAITFIILPIGLAFTKPNAPALLAPLSEPLLLIGVILAYVVAAFCLIRGILVIADARSLIWIKR